jgi:hypothetical protein
MARAGVPKDAQDAGRAEPGLPELLDECDRIPGAGDS